MASTYVYQATLHSSREHRATYAVTVQASSVQPEVHNRSSLRISSFQILFLNTPNLQHIDLLPAYALLMSVLCGALPQVAVTQGDDETDLTGFCPEAKVTCKAAAMDQLKNQLVAEITKSWAEHRLEGWADPVPQPRRSEQEIESDYTNDFVVCVLDIKVQV